MVDGDPYLTLAFSAGPLRADVTLGKTNTITVIDADTCRIVGATKDGKVAWNLQYQWTAPSWYAAKRLNVVSQPWELMSWNLYAGGERGGLMTVNGTKYQERHRLSRSQLGRVEL